MIAVFDDDRHLTTHRRFTDHVPMTFKERIVNAIVAGFFRLTIKLEVEGLENVPAEGPGIVIANHTSFFEGPLFYLIFRPRRTIALAKKELWDSFLTRAAMTAWQSVPVDRGGLDMKAIRGCFNVLDDGNFLCIAPEGTRSKDGALKRAMPGTTFFASRKEVPLYPLVVWGIRDMGANLKKLKRTKVNIALGKPFILEKKGGGKLGSEDRKQMADEMMYHLADLLPEHLRGVYSDPTERTSDYIKPIQA